MEEGTLVGLVRAGWLVLAFAMLFSRFLFQAAGATRMRAFLDGWQAGRTKRIWGAVALGYAAIVLAGALTVDGSPSALEWILLVLLLAVLLADGLVNVLPAGFRTFKDSVQEAWVRRRGAGSEAASDERLFLAGNLALGIAAAAMAAVVIFYEPIAPALVATSAFLAFALIAVLVRRRLR
jgi:hypothetical protein